MAALSLSLAAATAAVIARGDQVNVVPVDVAPSPGATNVSTGASLRLRFAQPMKPATVEARLAITPPVAGRFEWEGVTLVFVPTEPFQPGTNYRVELQPGAEESRGRLTRAPFAWDFRTRAPAVVVVRRANGVANLWLVDPVSGSARQLTRELVDVVEFAPAPDGSRIAYTRRDSTNRTTIWIVNIQTGIATQLTADAPAAFKTPAWSPNGKLIVFERHWDVAGTSSRPTILYRGADGAAGRPVYGSGDEVGRAARWAPDGVRLALIDPVRQAVILFHFFTRERVAVAVPGATTAAWSPDGRRLVVEAAAPGEGRVQRRLYLIDAASGTATPLTPPADTDDSAPAWSPDGRQIAFARRASAGRWAAEQVLTYDLATRSTRLLRELTPDDGRETATIAWSPAGRELVLSRQSRLDPAAEPDLSLLSVDAGLSRPLGSGALAAWLP